MSAVYAICNSEAQFVRIGNRLYDSGFSAGDISVLSQEGSISRAFGHQNSTKTPEGTAIGGGSGMVVGGALGWLAGIGALAIPGLGPFIAAGPLLATLSGAAIGGTLGGATGALVGMGIPEYEAQQYEGRLQEGNILIAVHADNDGEEEKIKDILTQENAQDIYVGNEMSVSSRRDGKHTTDATDYEAPTRRDYIE